MGSAFPSESVQRFSTLREMKGAGHILATKRHKHITFAFLDWDHYEDIVDVARLCYIDDARLETENDSRFAAIMIHGKTDVTRII